MNFWLLLVKMQFHWHLQAANLNCTTFTSSIFEVIFALERTMSYCDPIQYPVIYYSEQYIYTVSL